MRHLLLQADARRIPIASKSVHCVCTSPPYFGLRNYGDDRQIGLEPTPDEFVSAIVAVSRDIWRVLRDDGSYWLNLGDSFANDTKWGGSGSGPTTKNYTSGLGGCIGQKAKRNTGLKPKDLCMIPERVALALQADGWYLRAKPPWIKPSPMPESTCDRPNVAHESIFLLTKSPRYFFDMEAVRVPSSSATLAREQYSRIVQSGNKSHVPDQGDHTGLHKTYSVTHDHETPSNVGGRHLRTNDFFTASLDTLIDHHDSYAAHLRKIRDNGGLLLSEDGDPMAFWVAAKSFSGAHFATWPERLVRTMILASTSEKGCCPECGACWIRILERSKGDTEANGRPKQTAGMESRTSTLSLSGNGSAEWEKRGGKSFLLGWQSSCGCDPADPIPCTVLDPFGGAQTTPMVAVSLGRRGIGMDLNREYLAMGSDRIAESLRPVSRYDAPKPLKPMSGQLDLFAEAEVTP
jgi:DNA modification methylase